MAREQYLGRKVPAPNLATVKDSLRFYIHTSEPRIDSHAPTVDSMKAVGEWFFVGFERVTGTATDDTERTVYSGYKGFDRRGQQEQAQAQF
jgi:hypothetical protein